MPELPVLALYLDALQSRRVGHRLERGRVLPTEAGAKKRAALHVVRGQAELRRFDAGGSDPLTADLASFQSVLTPKTIHMLKRALTHPHLLSGIGNAYSDEILHRPGSRRSVL